MSLSFEIFLNHFEVNKTLSQISMMIHSQILIYMLSIEWQKNFRDRINFDDVISANHAPAISPLLTSVTLFH